jgi:hypothetical protein
MVITYLGAAKLENVMGVTMRRSAYRSGYFAGVVLLSVLVASTCFSQVQKIAPYNEEDSQLPDAPSAVAGVSDAPRDRIFDETSALHLLRDDDHNAWWRRSWNHIQNRSTLNSQALNHQKNTVVKLLRREEHPILSARAAWLTFDPTYDHVQPKTPHSVDDWQYYGHHLPVAGPVVLRVGQEAQAHPHIASIFKVIQPQF